MSRAERLETPIVWVEGSRYLMGSESHYPDEAHVRTVRLDGFWMDATHVTNADFAAFVNETGYVTVAERSLDPADFPGADPFVVQPGSMVFHMTKGPVDLRDISKWWAYLPGARWRHPEGPGSDLKGRAKHPVVHLAYEDAEAYAAWAGKSLPTEAEWEFTARGGLEGAEYVGGDELTRSVKIIAKTWQGDFPSRNSAGRKAKRTAPFVSYPPNCYGL